MEKYKFKLISRIETKHFRKIKSGLNACLDNMTVIFNAVNKLRIRGAK
jgi:hypothetical protein